MRRRVIMVFASAALAGSLLATDAQARGGGGHGRGGGTGHMSGFGGVHSGVRAGGYDGAGVGGLRGGYVTGIPRGAIGYYAGTGYGPGTGYETGIRYGTGILRGRYSTLAASALAQTAVSNNSTDGSVPAAAPGAAQNPPIGAPSRGTASGQGLTIVDRDGVSTKAVGMTPASYDSAPSNTPNQAAPAFRSGNLVRLRSGGPLMTVRDIKGDQVDCFWTDANGQINADSFPVDVLQMG
jgi:uncharacterized protein YodC (DUF2158 family)